MLGNAVPSLLAEALAWEIRFQFLGQRRRRVKYKLMPGYRPSMPKPEPATQVPKKYLKYVGDHSDHPGTGRGPKYQSSPATANPAKRTLTPDLISRRVSEK